MGLMTISLIRLTDKPQAHRPIGGHQQSGRGHRPISVLPERGMGHSRGACGETREVLLMLRRTLHRHILQHNPAAEDAVLHRQPDRALCGHILPVGVGVLPARRLQGENFTVHHDPPVPDHVFFAHLRDHTVDVAVVAPARQVPVVHHVAGRPVRGRHHHHHKHSLQVRRLHYEHNNIMLKLVFFCGGGGYDTPSHH